MLEPGDSLVVVVNSFSSAGGRDVVGKTVKVLRVESTTILAREGDRPPISIPIPPSSEQSWDGDFVSWALPIGGGHRVTYRVVAQPTYLTTGAGRSA